MCGVCVCVRCGVCGCGGGVVCCEVWCVWCVCVCVVCVVCVCGVSAACTVLVCLPQMMLESRKLTARLGQKEDEMAKTNDM